jgi:hypothetical protein
VAVLAPLCALAAVLLPGPLRFVGIAIGIYALMFNQVTLLQFALQSAKIFRPVAISAVAAPALFLGLVLLWHARRQVDYRGVTGLYIVSWLIVLIFLLAWTKPWSGAPRGAEVKGLAKQCVLSGWPILMANTGVIVTASDRLAVSWAATIQDFAQYSLAASALAVPSMAIQACSKVFFSHVAGVTQEGRKRIYGICSRTLLIAWAVLLPYYFALDVFVRHFLPRYIPSLQYARILLLGIPFLAAIQILQMSYAYLNGIQHQFLARTAAALAVSLAATSFAAFHAGSLRVVAGAQVAILGASWLVNEWTLRDVTGERAGSWVKFLAIYGAASAGYWIATAPTGLGTATSLLLYYGCVGIVLGVACRDELSRYAKILRGAEAWT